MHMLLKKNKASNIMYIVQELHTFLLSFNGITSKVSL